MYAYKEILTLEDPQHIKLSQPLPFLKGKKVEVLILVEDTTDKIDSKKKSNDILQNTNI
jgi:hypothetical protein